MAKLPIEVILALSTAHLSDATVEAIERGIEYKDADPVTRADNVEKWVRNLVIYRHGEYGWLVHVGDDLARNDDFVDEAPLELVAAVAIANANDCSWILYDRDGETINALPTHEW